MPIIIDASEISEAEWLHAASRNQAFGFLNAAEEDVYTLADGKPFQIENDHGSLSCESKS